MNTAYQITQNSIAVVHNGNSFTLRKDQPEFAPALSALKEGNYDAFYRICDKLTGVKAFVSEAIDGNVEVKGGSVLVDGIAFNNVLTERIIEFVGNGLPAEPLMNFLGRINENPSARAIQEAYRFLEHKKLPLTPSGTFLAYKAVQANYMSKTANPDSTYNDNSPGKLVQMKRNAVCDDAQIGCSTGLHVGSLEYAQDFASGNDKLVIVEVDPSKIVSVPFDCECQKMRVSEYRVIGDFKGAMETPLHDSDTGKPIVRDNLGQFAFGNNVHNKMVRDATGRFVRKS